MGAQEGEHPGTALVDSREEEEEEEEKEGNGDGDDQTK